MGILVAPLLTGLVNLILKGFTGSTPAAPLHVTVLLSAISIAHAFGEGLGRLACLSFGCCYGKPLAQCSPRMQTLAGPFCLVFHGKTKKIAYASGLDGQRVLPVQVVTAVLYNGAGLTGTALFLWGHFGAALVICLMVTQVWRMVSEFFRGRFPGRLHHHPLPDHGGRHPPGGPGHRLSGTAACLGPAPAFYRA